LYDASTTPVLKGTVKANATKLVLEAYPVISSTTKSEDLILTISNPKGNDESIEIAGFKVSGKVKTASLNKKVLDDAAIASLSNLPEANRETV
jgi:hypothetical protein